MKKVWTYIFAVLVGVSAFGAVAYAMFDVNEEDRRAASTEYSEMYQLHLLDQQVQNRQ